MKRLVISVCLAALLWFVMFSPWTAPLLNFWWAMTTSACILIALSTLAQRRDGGSSILSQFTIFNFKEVFLGIGIAVVLWFVFYVGDKASQWMFDFARQQVNLIYDIKTGNQPWLIALLLLFIIGPAEEIFWRGYIQRQLSQRWSPNVGFLVTTAIYTAVHLPSGNFMLVMAAMVCGVAWGGLYRLMPQHFPAIVLSHALWDAAAFVWFPL